LGHALVALQAGLYELWELTMQEARRDQQSC